MPVIALSAHVRIPLHRCHRLLNLRHAFAAQVGCHPTELTERLLPSATVAALGKLDEHLAGCPHVVRLSRLGGMVVLRSMSLVITPPTVTKPMGKGVTSNSRKSCTVRNHHLLWLRLALQRHLHCFIKVDGPVGPLSLKNSWTMGCTLGI